MEEIPLSPEKLTPKAELTPDPEKIGDLLLRYELPKPEKPSVATPLLVEQNPKVLISRENLLDRIKRYKNKRFGRHREQDTEVNYSAELSEVQFDRRREAIDEPAQHNVSPRMDPELPADAFSQTPASPPPPPASPPPITSVAVNKGDKSNAGTTLWYKKPLLFGLAAGVLTGAVLILLYVRR